MNINAHKFLFFFFIINILLICINQILEITILNPILQILWYTSLIALLSYGIKTIYRVKKEFNHENQM